MVLMVIALNFHPPRSFFFRSLFSYLRLEVVKCDSDVFNPKDFLELYEHYSIKLIFKNTFGRNFDWKAIKTEMLQRIALKERNME